MYYLVSEPLKVKDLLKEDEMWQKKSERFRHLDNLTYFCTVKMKEEHGIKASLLKSWECHPADGQ
jgi:hypothetical protein